MTVILIMYRFSFKLIDSAWSKKFIMIRKSLKCYKDCTYFALSSTRTFKAIFSANYFMIFLYLSFKISSPSIYSLANSSIKIKSYNTEI